MCGCSEVDPVVTMLSPHVVKIESKLSPSLPDSCSDGRGFQPWHKPGTSSQPVRTSSQRVVASASSANSGISQAESSLFKYASTNPTPATSSYATNFFPNAPPAANTYSDLTKGLGDGGLNTASALQPAWRACTPGCPASRDIPTNHGR